MTQRPSRRAAFLPKELKKKADAFVLPEDVRADVDRLVASSENPAFRRRAIVAYETEQGRQEAQRLMSQKRIQKR